MRQLTAKQKKVLKNYIEQGGDALFYDELPYSLREELEAINDTEILWSETERFLQDNRMQRSYGLPAWKR